MRRRCLCEFPVGIEKREMKFRKIFSETAEPISTKLC
jgi:hypothetical protein